MGHSFISLSLFVLLRIYSVSKSHLIFLKRLSMSEIIELIGSPLSFTRIAYTPGFAGNLFVVVKSFHSKSEKRKSQLHIFMAHRSTFLFEGIPESPFVYRTFLHYISAIFLNHLHRHLISV